MGTNMLDTSCMNNNTRPDSASRNIPMVVAMVITMIGIATVIVIIATVIVIIATMG